MHKYAILQDPGHNRVYYKQSQKLSLAELKIACEKFNGKCHDFATISIANIKYFSFEIETEISEKELGILSRLSFVFAIFEVSELNGKEVLIPVEKQKYEYVDPKISSILKYHGKTNEIFTKMMIDVAMLSTEFDENEVINLLDPLAGKGTTLFEGLVHGFNVTGIEIEAKPVQEIAVFFKKFLEGEKYKHHIQKGRLHVKETTAAAVTHSFSFARSKEEFKDENSRKKLLIINGNSIYTSQYLKKNSFHLIVGDLPCGAALGNTARDKTSAIARNPAEFLAASLPEWYKVLKKKGVLVLAWNKFVMPRKDFVALLEANDFEVLTESPYDEFEHKVDASIKRDIVVARK